MDQLQGVCEQLQKRLAWTPSESDIATIARVCHEANRALCVSQGDTSQSAWEDAPDWQRASCVSGVKVALEKLYADTDESHDHWMATKLRDGWRYGPVKDVEKKEHPCLLPSRFLPAEQRVKDEVFTAIVAGYRLGMERSTK